MRCYRLRLLIIIEASIETIVDVPLAGPQTRYLGCTQKCPSNISVFIRAVASGVCVIARKE